MQSNLMFLSRKALYQTVCLNDEIKDYNKFSMRNWLNAFETRFESNPKEIFDIESYKKSFLNHKQMVEDYLKNLEEEEVKFDNRKKTDTLAFARSKLIELVKNIQTIINKENLDERMRPMFIGDELSIDDIERMKTYFESREPSPYTPEKIAKIKTFMNEIVGNQYKQDEFKSQICIIKETIEESIDFAVNNESLYTGLSDIDRVLLDFFFNSFKNYQFSKHNCKNHKYLSVRNKIFETVYKYKPTEIKDDKFDTVHKKIIPHIRPHLVGDDVKTIVDNDLEHIKGDKDLLSIGLPEIIKEHKKLVPTSIEFMEFLGESELKFKNLGIKKISDPDNEDTPTDIYGKIYKLYIMARNGLPDEDKQHMIDPEEQKLENITSKLYDFVAETDLFNPTDIPFHKKLEDLKTKKLGLGMSEIDLEEEEQKHKDKEDKLNKILEEFPQANDYREMIKPEEFMRDRPILLIALGGAELEDPSPSDIKNKLNDIVDSLVDLPGIEDVDETYDFNSLKDFLPQKLEEAINDTKMVNVLVSFKKKHKPKAFANREGTPQTPKKRLQMIEKDVDNDVDDLIQNFKPSTDKDIDRHLGLIKNMTSGLNNPLDAEISHCFVKKIVSKINDKIQEKPEITNTTSGKLMKKMYLKVKSYLLIINLKKSKDIIDGINGEDLYKFMYAASVQTTLNDLGLAHFGEDNSELHKDMERMHNIDRFFFVPLFVACKETLKGIDITMENLSLIGKKLSKQTRPSSTYLQKIVPHNIPSERITTLFVFQHFLTSEDYGRFLFNMKFLAELTPLFRQFNDGAPEGFESKYWHIYKVMYKFLFDIRLENFDIEQTSPIQLVNEKLAELQNSLANHNPELMTNPTFYSNITYREALDMHFFVAYFMEKNGLQEKAVQSLILSDSTNLILDVEDFFVFLKTDKPFFDELCSLSDDNPVRVSDFCLQARIFLMTFEYVLRPQTGNFNEWYTLVFPHEVENAILERRYNVYEAMEILHHQIQKSKVTHIETLMHIFDGPANKINKLTNNKKLLDVNDQEAINFNKLANNKELLDVNDQEAINFYKLFAITKKDLDWATNYAQKNFNLRINGIRLLIASAVDRLFESGDYEHLIDLHIKFILLNNSIKTREINTEALRLFLLFAQKTENYRKIVELLLKEGKTHLLIFLQRGDSFVTPVSNLVLRAAKKHSEAYKLVINASTSLDQLEEADLDEATDMLANDIQNILNDYIKQATSEIEDQLKSYNKEISESLFGIDEFEAIVEYDPNGEDTGSKSSNDDKNDRNGQISIKVMDGVANFDFDYTEGEDGNSLIQKMGHGVQKMINFSSEKQKIDLDRPEVNDNFDFNQILSSEKRNLQQFDQGNLEASIIAKLREKISNKINDVNFKVAVNKVFNSEQDDKETIQASMQVFNLQKLNKEEREEPKEREEPEKLILL